MRSSQSAMRSGPKWFILNDSCPVNVHNAPIESIWPMRQCDVVAIWTINSVYRSPVGAAACGSFSEHTQILLIRHISARAHQRCEAHWNETHWCIWMVHWMHWMVHWMHGVTDSLRDWQVLRRYIRMYWSAKSHSPRYTQDWTTQYWKYSSHFQNIILFLRSFERESEMSKSV